MRGLGAAVAGAIVMVAVTAAVVVGVVVVVGRNRGGDGLPTSSDVNKYGWVVTQWPDQHILDGYEGRPFHALKRPEVSDSFSGSHRGREFLAANFSYSEGNGTGTVRTRWYAHVAVTLPAGGPLVEITPRGGSYADPFDRRFRVRTDDDAFAGKIIDGGLSAYLSAQPEPPPLTFEHGEVRTWLPDTIDDDQLLDLLDYLCDAIDAIPSEVWREPGKLG